MYLCVCTSAIFRGSVHPYDRVHRAEDLSHPHWARAHRCRHRANRQRGGDHRPGSHQSQDSLPAEFPPGRSQGGHEAASGVVAHAVNADEAGPFSRTRGLPLMRGWDAVRAQLGYEYPIGSWFCVPGDKALTRRGRPFDRGKDRPVMLATRLGPDAVLFPRSTKPGGFRHDAHRHDPPDPCSINQRGGVILAVPVAVDLEHLNDESYSCEEPEDSSLLVEVRRRMRP